MIFAFFAFFATFNKLYNFVLRHNFYIRYETYPNLKGRPFPPGIPPYRNTALSSLVNFTGYLHQLSSLVIYTGYLH